MNIDDITEQMKQIRSELYTKKNTTESENPTAIKGFCHKNALYTARRIADIYSDYQVWLIWGGLEDELYSQRNIAHQQFPETIYNLELSGVTHFWVEIPLTDTHSNRESRETLKIDPFALTPDEHNHSLYINTTLPENYFTLPGSILTFEYWLTPDKLISETEYRNLPDELFDFEKCESCEANLG
jgi:hypothetical protein